MLGLRHLEHQTCECGCGLPRAVAHDEGRNFATQAVTCHARKWLSVAQRDAHQKSLPPDKRDKEWREGKPQPGDGELWRVWEHTETPTIQGGTP